MIKCPICEAKLEENSFTETYISPFNNQEYKKYECPNCDVHWWEPLRIIPEFYESEVFGAYTAFHEGLREDIQVWHIPFFENFPKDVKGKLLDIGCGDGIFLKSAQKMGFEVYGIDFDRKSIEVAKKLLNTDTVYPMSLEEFVEYAREENLKFDVITFFEVLEHQDNPKVFLNNVKELLKIGGYIAGTVPNRDRLFREMDWKYEWWDFPPHHFLRFSKKSLENTLKILGFKDIVVIRTDYHFRKAQLYELERISNESKSLSVELLKFLKRIKNALLYLFAFRYIIKAKGNGLNLYF